MLEKLRLLVDEPTVSPTSYLCSECEVLLDYDHGSCPECGGEVEIASETLHSYWFRPR